MTGQQFSDWKTEAVQAAAKAIHAGVETAKADDLADRTMLGRAIADKIWTHFETIIDDRSPHAVEAVLIRIAAMTLDELAAMIHHIQ